MASKRALSPREWQRRRRRLDLGLTFLAGLSVYILWYDTSSAVQQAAITVLIPSFVSLIGAYIFGATWDDKNYMDNIAKLGGQGDNDIDVDIDTSYPK